MILINMEIMNLLNSLVSTTKEIDLKKLPSLGIFYKDDFNISIKKADINDILEYEDGLIDDIYFLIPKIKNIVKKNTIFSEGYTFNDIKSIDIIFLFLEIVKLTNNIPVYMEYYNEFERKSKIIEFGYKTFKYFEIDEDILNLYDNNEKCININGYKYTLPTIGVENSITNYLIKKVIEGNTDSFFNYFFDFTHFLGHKNNLSFSEVENLIKIFNFDIEDSEFRKVKEIIKKFEGFQTYKLKDKDVELDFKFKIDLVNIWK